MNNVLMWVAGAIALALCALFAVPPIVDWNQYRGVFEEEVSRMLGREVRVGGKVNLRILPVPYVRFEKVRIADAPGIPGSFVRVDNFTLLLAVPPLLRGVFEARELEIDGPTLRLRFDENGGGNWQKLNIRGHNLAFLPNDFALQSAMVKNGRIIVESHRGEEIAQVNAINGELVAGALRGPYRFAGSAKIGETPLELRMATAEADPSGNVLVTATATNSATGAKHNIKGRLSDLGTMPKLLGELSSRAPLRLGAANNDAGANYDLRAGVAIDHTSAELTNLTISFDTEGRPQQLAGRLKASWTESLAVSGQLKSNWLDLDAITGGRTKQAPFRIIELFAGSGFGFGEKGSTQIDLDIEQASLGGQIASALTVRLVHANGEVRADRVSAALPGNSRLRADGLITFPKNGFGWQGHALVRGGNLERFSNWAWPGGLAVTGSAAGPFEVSGALRYAPGTFEFANAMANVAGRPSRGRGKYSWTAKPLLTIAWEADSIDLSGFGRDVLANNKLAQLFGLQATDSKAASQIRQHLQRADFDLRLQASEISDGKRTLGEVDVLISRTGNKLRLGKSKLTIEPGLTIAVEGELRNIDKEPEWGMSGVVRARSKSALDELSGLIKIAVGDDALPVQSLDSYPLDLAITTNSAVIAGHRATNLEADGSLLSDRLGIMASTNGPLQRWKDNQLRLDVRLDGYTIKTLSTVLGGGDRMPRSGKKRTAAAGSSAAAAQPSFLRMNVAGVPKNGLQASATVASGQWQLRLRGEGRPGADGQLLSWSGTGKAAFRNIKHFAGLVDAGLKNLFVVDAPAGGQFQFRQVSGDWIIEPVDFNLAGSLVTGQIALAKPKPNQKRFRVSGELNVDRIYVGAVLTALIKPGAAKPAISAEQNISQSQSVWPDRPFDLSALSVVDADVKIATRRLNLAPGLNAVNAAFTVKTDNGKLTFKQSQGLLLAGTMKGEATLAAAPAGVNFTGSLSVSGAKMSSLVSTAMQGQVGGRMSVRLKAKAQAISPRALMTTLRGKGQLRLQQAKLPGLEVKMLAEIADSIVIGDVGPNDLNARIIEAVNGGSVNIGSRKVALKLSDGVLEVAGIEKRSTSARMVNQTVVDILRMAIDSQWRVDTVLKRALDEDTVPKPLPSIQLVYTGAISRLSDIEPSVSTGDLQRELIVQKMEHDVRRLEKLRREDEERAKLEAERLRQLELDRQRALDDEARKRSHTNGQN